MRSLLTCWFASCLSLAAGTLKFESTSKEITVALDQKTATVDYPFKNESTSDVEIAQNISDCPCAAVGVKDSKLIYKPGESGTLRVVFNMEKVPETTDKYVAIFLKGDPEERPSFRLTTHIIVPVVVDIQPKSLIWKTGDKLEPKTMTVTMNDSSPVKILSITSSDPRFKQELKTVEEGKKYEVVITPTSTEKVGMASLRIETDSKTDTRPAHIVYLSVQSAPKSAPADK